MVAKILDTPLIMPGIKAFLFSILFLSAPLLLVYQKANKQYPSQLFMLRTGGEVLFMLVAIVLL
jgi:hypothetical protein